MRFLLFTLYAPMGSFGEIAVGERRMSWARPGRSAVFGLVAAALGIDRGDEAGHSDLDTGLYFAVRADSAGRPFIDYHTAQTPKARKGRSFATRRQEVLSGDSYTVLSSREWLADPCFTVSLWPRLSGCVDLEHVATALQRPRFALYLGRKSAPLGLPLNPAIVDAHTFMDALAARRRSDVEQDVLDRIRDGRATEMIVAFDQDAPGAPAGARLERRRDSIVSRERWQFADRLEGVATVRSSE